MRVVAVLLAILIGQIAAQAQVTVDYNGGSGIPFVADHTGTVLPDSVGNNVELGFFDTIGGYDFTAHLNDLSSLGSHWHLFDATNIRTIFGQTGAFGGTGTQLSTLFNNMHIDLFIFKTADLLAPAVDFSNVLEYGIFTSTSLAWTFPAQGTAPPGNHIIVQTDQVNQAFHGGLIPPDPNAQPPYLGALTLVEVPEPTGLALLGLGLAALLGRRARR